MAILFVSIDLYRPLPEPWSSWLTVSRMPNFFVSFCSRGIAREYSDVVLQAHERLTHL